MLDTAFMPGSIGLADGRRLAYATAGSPTGYPVLYLHGAIGSPLRADERLAAAIARHDLRWICVQRPGFGASDRSPGRTLLDFTADVRSLASALGLERLAITGVSAGGPYALACGHELADLVDAVAVCSSLSALCAPHAVPGLPCHTRAGLQTLARAPRPCVPALNTLAWLLRRHQALLRRVTRPEALDGLVAATGGGVRGLVEDYLVCCRPWGFEPRDVHVEVQLWHGLEDRLVPAEHAWQLAAALPSCRVAFDPAEDHFFFRRRIEEIVAGLVAGRAADPTAGRVPS